jgi:CBS domain-containing protein
MVDQHASVIAFLETVHPYDSLPQDELARVAGSFGRRSAPAGTLIYRAGDVLEGLYLVERGGVEVTDRNGVQVSLLGPRNSFGERGLSRDGHAMTTARATADTALLLLPAAEFHRLVAAHPAFARFFDRTRPAEGRKTDLTTLPVTDLMATTPLSVAPDTPIVDCARLMRDRRVSCLGIVRDGRLIGLVTVRDLANRVLAEGLDAGLPVSRVMTPDPASLPPTALGSDVLHVMLERRIGHLPIVERGRLLGIITQTDLTRFQAVSSALLIRDIAMAPGIAEMAETTARIPQLLVQLVAAGNRHEVVTRLVTDIADAVTRRLLKMAESTLGPAPVPWLWLACGSQGRQEQTGVSDQDNCLMLDDAYDEAVHGAYFDEFARLVSVGLNDCGYVFCPGDMMATNPRWRQPMRVWRQYFTGWVTTPSPEAQMLASVMFDLRPIGGSVGLFADLQAETLDRASRNSIFVAHMISNSLKHQPPLGLIRSFATIRSGEHKDRLDLKHNGVVPVVDLGRIYALRGRIEAANTRARLSVAEDLGVISASGGSDLIDAYDMIAQTRLDHQARLVRAGARPDNFMTPTDLSDFERSHLRDAFVVVRTMQSALGQGKGMLG